MEASYLSLSPLRTLTLYKVCICSHLLLEETSLIMAEQGTGLRVQQNILRSHLISTYLFVCCLFQNSSIGSTLGWWANQSQVLGHPRSVGYGFYDMECTLQSNQILVDLCHHYTGLSCRQETIQMVEEFAAGLVLMSFHWQHAEYLPAPEILSHLSEGFVQGPTRFFNV